MPTWINVSPVSFTIEVDGVPVVVPSRSEFEAPHSSVAHLVRLGRVVPGAPRHVELEGKHAEKQEAAPQREASPAVPAITEASAEEARVSVVEQEAAADNSDAGSGDSSASESGSTAPDDVSFETQSRPSRPRKRRGRKKG